MAITTRHGRNSALRSQYVADRFCNIEQFNYSASIKGCRSSQFHYSRYHVPGQFSSLPYAGCDGAILGLHRSSRCLNSSYVREGVDYTKMTTVRCTFTRHAEFRVPPAHLRIQSRSLTLSLTLAFEQLYKLVPYVSNYIP